MAKLLPSIKPFENWKIYGPYLGTKGRSKYKRRFVTLKSDNKTTTMAYARYLVCVREGRWLDINEEVDHIDENCLNDEIDNLQILSHAENVAKSGSGIAMVELKCPWCNCLFLKEKRRMSYKGKYPPSCSRSCSTKYQRVNESNE